MTLSQATPQAPTPTPAPAAPAGAPTFLIGDLQLPATGYTQEFVNTLMTRKDALSDQLSSASGRREDVVEQIQKATSDASRGGLEQRLKVLDTRIAQIETDIATNGRLIAAAPATFVRRSSSSSQREPDRTFGPLSSGQLTAISIVFTLSVLMPMAISMSRAFFRRAAQPKPSPQILESAARLERMEQAVDAIAVEVERISEGQRFVTQLMAKREEVPVLGAESRVR
jgi:archaellum component FlaC